jgi:NAD(P)-dependent dehydrogenase (short-subunit alcohol dehydrogenase family)
LTQSGSVEDEAIVAFGSLEVVINNAGYGNLSSVEDTPMSDFREVVAMSKSHVPRPASGTIRAH